MTSARWRVTVVSPNAGRANARSSFLKRASASSTAPSATAIIVYVSPAAMRALSVSHTTSRLKGISGMRIICTPAAMPDCSVSQPALLPMTSTSMMREWLRVVVSMRSKASVTTSTAVRNPNVTSVPKMSLSMVLGTPMTLQPSIESSAAVLCVPAPPSVNRQSSPIFL